MTDRGEWLPGPRYLCRRFLVRALLKELVVKQGSFLEIGGGGSDIALRLCHEKWQGVVMDVSEQAIQLLKRKCYHSNPELKKFLELVQGDFRQAKGSYDLILLFEVLEHLADDLAALAKIHDLLKPQGELLLSVPSHQKDWGGNDVWAGHIRRYEKVELTFKLEENHFKIKRFWTYGFPIANIIEPLKNRVVLKDMNDSLSLEERTHRSGVERVYLSPFRFLLNDWVFSPFLLLQKGFLNSDLGNGYLVYAQRD